MMDANLIQLAERVEAAEGPSRELDAAIMEAFTDEIGTRPLWMLQAKIASGAKGTHEAPRFTASIDAALTLVPEGWMWNAGSNGEWGGARCWRSIDAPDVVIAATPALALCAAALRAKAKGGHDAAL